MIRRRVACRSPGTTGGAATDIMPGTWSCTVGEGDIGKPLLLATDSEVKFGLSLLGEETVFQSLTR